MESTYTNKTMLPVIDTPVQEEDNAAWCPVCTAACTYEAMCWCVLPAEDCPVMKRPYDRTARDDNGFPFEFLPAPGYDYAGEKLPESAEQV